MNIIKHAYLNSNKADKAPVLMYAIVIAGLIALEVYATYLVPEWKKYFYNVLEAKDKSKLVMSVVYFSALMCALIMSQSLKLYVSRLLSLSLRTIITSNLWIRAFWRGKKHTVDNVAQRINQDVQIATDNMIRVWIEIIISTLLVFIMIINNLNNKLIVWSSVIYTIVICAASFLFKKPLINTEIGVQMAEASHRRGLIADEQHASMFDTVSVSNFDTVKKNLRKYLNVMLGYNIFNAGQNSFSVIIPWAILSVPYFNGQTSLGDFMAGVSVFETIVINSTILVSMYPEVTKYQASLTRVNELHESLNRG